MAKINRLHKYKKPGTQARSGKTGSGLLLKTLAPPDHGIHFMVQQDHKKKKSAALKALKKKHKKAGHVLHFKQALTELLPVIGKDEHDEHLTVMQAKHIRRVMVETDLTPPEQELKMTEDILYWMHTNGLQHTATYASFHAIGSHLHNEQGS